MKLGECTESDFEPYSVVKNPVVVTPVTAPEKQEKTAAVAAQREKQQRRVRVRSRQVRA